jgi:AbrB family looped-hinge helix DNA binding protein
MLTKLSSKGQVIIPKPIQEELHLKYGSQFYIRIHEGSLILEPLKKSAIDILYGKYSDTDFLSDLETEHKQEIKKGGNSVCS